MQCFCKAKIAGSNPVEGSNGMATPVLTSPREKRIGTPTHVREEWDPPWCPSVLFCRIVLTYSYRGSNSTVESQPSKLLVASSNLVFRSRGISSVGRAPALQAGCQEFESPILHSRKGIYATFLCL